MVGVLKQRMYAASLCRWQELWFESHCSNSRIPCFTNSLHFLDKPRARDLQRPGNFSEFGIMLIRDVERISKKTNIRHL